MRGVGAIFPVNEWEQKVLRRLKSLERKKRIKPLSDKQVKSLTKEIFLED